MVSGRRIGSWKKRKKNVNRPYAISRTPSSCPPSHPQNLYCALVALGLVIYPSRCVKTCCHPGPKFQFYTYFRCFWGPREKSKRKITSIFEFLTPTQKYSGIVVPIRLEKQWSCSILSPDEAAGRKTASIHPKTFVPLCLSREGTKFRQTTDYGFVSSFCSRNPNIGVTGKQIYSGSPSEITFPANNSYPLFYFRSVGSHFTLRKKYKSWTYRKLQQSATSPIRNRIHRYIRVRTNTTS